MLETLFPSPDSRKPDSVNALTSPDFVKNLPLCPFAISMKCSSQLPEQTVQVSRSEMRSLSEFVLRCPGTSERIAVEAGNTSWPCTVSLHDKSALTIREWVIMGGSVDEEGIGLILQSLIVSLFPSGFGVKSVHETGRERIAASYKSSRESEDAIGTSTESLGLASDS